eukprot:5246406-Prymnesium_polylepis.1
MTLGWSGCVSVCGVRSKRCCLRVVGSEVCCGVRGGSGHPGARGLRLPSAAVRRVLVEWLVRGLCPQAQRSAHSHRCTPYRHATAEPDGA